MIDIREYKVDPVKTALFIDTYVSYVGAILACCPSPDRQGFWLRFFAARQVLRKLELSEFIDAIGELCTLPEGLEYPARDAAHEIILAGKSANQDIAKWLRFYLLRGKPIPEVISAATRWHQTGLEPPSEVMTLVNRYPFACEAIETLRLAKATYLKSPALSSLFPTPFALWACIQCSEERLLLRTRGITGNPVIFGKTDYLENNASGIKAYNGCEVKTSDQESPAWIRETHWSEMLHSLLLIEAHEIARKDDDFSKHHYTPYCRFRRKINNLLKRCDQMQAIYRLPDGSAFTTGKYNKIPKKHKPEGFMPRRATSEGKSRRNKKLLTELNKKPK